MIGSDSGACYLMQQTNNANLLFPPAQFLLDIDDDQSGLYLFLQVQYPLSLVSIKYKHFLIFGWGNHHHHSDHHFIIFIIDNNDHHFIIILFARWANSELSDLDWFEASSLDWNTRRPSRVYYRSKSEGVQISNPWTGFFNHFHPTLFSSLSQLAD